MKKIWVLILASLFLSACGVSKLIPSNTTGETKQKVGDVVVAKWAVNSFYEGKIDKIDGSKITVAWLDKSSATGVDAIDVYAIPVAGTKSDAKTGDIVLAKTNSGTAWEGVEITGIEGDVYKVKSLTSATTVNVPAEKIIKISSVTVADFKEKAGATDFLKEAQKAKPTVPADYKPKKGDKVVGEWTTNTWYSGKIDNISGSNIYVAWDDNTKPSAVNSSKIIPLPTADNKETLKENQFLLVKPESGSKWEYVQVTTIKGNSADVKFADGKTRSVKPNEFIGLN